MNQGMKRVFFGFYNNKAYFKGQDYVLKESKFQNAHGFN